MKNKEIDKNIENDETDNVEMNEEDIKKFNMYQAELRQKSIERYGRDIYSQKEFIPKGLKGMKKVNKGIENILKIFLIFCIISIVLGTAYCLWIGWGDAYTKNKDYIHFGEKI